MIITLTLYSKHAIYLTDEEIDRITREIKEHMFKMREEGCKCSDNICSEYRWLPNKAIVERMKNFINMIKEENK